MNASRLGLLSGLLLGLAACAGCVPPPTSAPSPPPVGDTVKAGGPSAGTPTGGAGSPTDKDKKPPVKTKPAAPPPANPVPPGDPPPANAPGPDDGAIDPELKALCGVWGHTGQAGYVTKLTFRKDGSYQEEVDVSDPERGTFTIDATKRPRTLDLNDGDGQTQTLCIYEIKGKELTLARHANDGMKRPRGFSGKDVIVEKYDRY